MPEPDLHPLSARPDAKPDVDVRIVLLTVADGCLLTALEREADRWRLPRGVPAPGEALDLAATRIIHDATTHQQHYHEQLYTLSIGQESSWTVIIAYLALFCSAQRPESTATSDWHDVAALPALSEADRMVTDYALLRLRAKLGYTNIAFHLLPQTFTLTELQSAYETILGRQMDKRNFRRRLTASRILEATNAKRRDGSHRPAALYRFHAGHDPADYLTPSWAENS